MGTEPYVGLRPFQRAERRLFFGRGHETRELVSLVVAHQEVLLHARSGAGKSSLLNTRVMPLLEEEGFEVLGAARLRNPLPASPDPGRVANVFLFNALQSWRPDADPEALAVQSLAEFLARRPPGPRVLVFDQFEDVFTSHPQRWQDREELFRQLGRALGDDRLLRALFVLREDYLAPFEAFRHHLPEKLRIRYRLERLGRKSALAAVTGPLPESGPNFGPGVAEQLVGNLMRRRVVTEEGEMVEVAEELVEPVALQVSCQSLWRQLPPGVGIITAEHLRAFGDVDQALAQFYDESLRTAAKGSGTGEGKLRTWFEDKLITPAGTRAMVFQEREETGGIPNRAVETLEDLHLIHGERRAGARWFELAHDRFIEPIRLANRRWREQDRESEQIRRQLESKAREWVVLGRAGEGLLDELELRQARRWLESPLAAELGPGETLLALVEASQAEIEKRQQERELGHAHELLHQRARANRALAAAVLLVLVVAALLLWLRNRERDQARMGVAQYLTVTALFEKLPQHSQLLAVEALNVAQGVGEPRLAFAEEALRRALARAQGRAVGRPGETVLATAITPDRRWLVTQGRDQTLLLRRFSKTGLSQAPIVLSGHPGRLHAVAVSADDRWLAATGGDETVRRWDLKASGQPLVPFIYPPQALAINTLGISPDQPRLLTIDEARVPRLWDPSPEPTAVALPCPQGVVKSTPSPGWRWLATSCDDGSALVWKLTAANPAADGAVLRGHEGEISALAFSADENRLATGSADRTVRLWELADPSAPPLVLAGHQAEVTAVAFTPDDRWLLTGGGDGMVRLWELSGQAPTGEAIDLPAHEKQIHGLDLSPDGRWLLTRSAEEVPRLWDLRAADPAAGSRLVEGHPDNVEGAFSPDGRWLVTGGQGRAVRLWDLQGEDPSAGAKLLQAHEDPVGLLAVSADGTWLLTRDLGGHARLWDLTAANPRDGPEPLIFRLRPPAGAVRALAPSPDARWLATAGEDGTIRLWDLTVGDRIAEPISWSGQVGAIEKLAVSPAGDHLVAYGSDSAARVWKLEGPAVAPAADPMTGIAAVAFSPDHRWVVLAGRASPTRWDLTAEDLGPSAIPLGEPEQQLRGPLAISSQRQCRGQQWLVTAAGDERPRLWSPELPGAIVLRQHEGGLVAPAFSLGRCWMVTGDRAGNVRLWDLDRIAKLARQSQPPDPVRTAKHRDAVTAAAFSPDNRWLVTASADPIAALWQLAELEEDPIPLYGHGAAVTAVGFSNDSRWLATAGAAGDTRIWDLSAENLTAVVLEGHEGEIHAVAFDAGSRWLFTAGGDGAVRRWRLRLEELMDLACRTAGRNLTAEEWTQYLGGERYRTTCPDFPAPGQVGSYF